MNNRIDVDKMPFGCGKMLKKEMPWIMKKNSAWCMLVPGNLATLSIPSECNQHWIESVNQ